MLEINVSQNDWEIQFLGDVVETGLPSGGSLSGALRGHNKEELIMLVHEISNLIHHVNTFGAVNRNATYSLEGPAKRAIKQLLLTEKTIPTGHLITGTQTDWKVAGGRVRNCQYDSFPDVFRYTHIAFPPPKAKKNQMEKPGKEFSHVINLRTQSYCQVRQRAASLSYGVQHILSSSASKRIKMRKLPFFMLALAVTVISSCADKEDLDPALFGTWQVTKVQGQLYFNNVPMIPLSDNNPSGTVRFDKNGTGYQNYSFQLAGNTNSQVGAFRWTATDSEILIDRQNEPDMVWQRVTNLSTRQVATFTFVEDGSTRWDYTLTMEK